MDVNFVLKKHGISPDPAKDQHFLSDQPTIRRIIDELEVNKTDIVYEVGAGIGSLTDSIPPCAHVFAVDIDPALCAVMRAELRATHIEIIEANALEHLPTATFTKLLSSTPYSICEPLLKHLFIAPFSRAVLIVPTSFAEKITSAQSTLGFFSGLFLEATSRFTIPREAFNPRPRTDSIAIALSKKPAHPSQALYLYRHVKLKNLLRETLARSGRTRREARALVASLLSPDLLEKPPARLTPPELARSAKAFHS